MFCRSILKSKEAIMKLNILKSKKTVMKLNILKSKKTVITQRFNLLQNAQLKNFSVSVINPKIQLEKIDSLGKHLFSENNFSIFLKKKKIETPVNFPFLIPQGRPKILGTILFLFFACFFFNKRKMLFNYLQDGIVKRIIRFFNLEYKLKDKPEFIRAEEVITAEELIKKSVKYFKDFELELEEKRRIMEREIEIYITWKIFLFGWFLVIIFWLGFFILKFILKAFFSWLKLKLLKLFTLYKLYRLRLIRNKIRKHHIAFLKRMIELDALLGGKILKSLQPIEDIINSILKDNGILAKKLLDKLIKERALFGFKGLDLLPSVSEKIDYIIRNSDFSKTIKKSFKILRVWPEAMAMLQKLTSKDSYFKDGLLDLLNEERQFFNNEVLPKILPFVSLPTLSVEEIVDTILNNSPVPAYKQICISIFFPDTTHTLLEYLEYCRKYFGSISKTRSPKLLASVVVITHMIKKFFS